MTVMVTPIDSTREDMIRSLEARATALNQGAEEHPRDVVIYRELRKMSDQAADAFTERIKEVLDDFEDYEEDGEGEDIHVRALTVAFYPSFYYEPDED